MTSPKLCVRVGRKEKMYKFIVFVLGSKSLQLSFQYVKFYAVFSYKDRYFDTIFRVKELGKVTFPFSSIEYNGAF